MLSDAFGGTGFLDAHPSDQGKVWMPISGSLSLDGSGLTTDSNGDGEYYLDDASYGVASPPQVDLFLNLPVIPTPDEAFDIYLFALGVGVDGDSQNYLSLQLECPPTHVYKVTALSVDALGGADFTAWANLAGPPSKLSIDPQTQKFYVDDVLIATLGHPPTWGAASRVGLRMSFVTGVDVHATSISAATASPTVDKTAAETGTAGGAGTVVLPGRYVLTYRVVRRNTPDTLETLVLPGASGVAVTRDTFWKHLPAADVGPEIRRIEIIDIRPQVGAEAVQ